MKTKLHKRLQVLEKRLAPPRGDLHRDITIRALAQAFTLDQLQRLREMARGSGSVELPPEWAAERDRYVELCDRISLLLTGKLYAELRGDEIPGGEIPYWL
jgi:hypothetical protein